MNKLDVGGGRSREKRKEVGVGRLEAKRTGEKGRDREGRDYQWLDVKRRSSVDAIVRKARMRKEEGRRQFFG